MTDLIRRNMMMDASAQANNCATLSVNVDYISTSNRNMYIYIDGKLCLIGTGLVTDSVDVGFITIKYTVPDYPLYNVYSIVPTSEYRVKKKIYNGGEEMIFECPNFPTYYKKEIYLLNTPKLTQYYCDLTFDFNDGGNGRRVLFNFCGIGEGIATRQMITNSTLFRNTFADFKIVNIVTSVDYYAIEARTQFTCDGVVYNAGEKLEVPWGNPTSTKITKRIYF